MAYWQNKVKWDISPKETENPMQSIHTSISGHVRDMGIDKRDAWIYGIAVGWDDESYKEFQKDFGWSDEVVARNKRLHEKFIACWLYIQE